MAVQQQSPPPGLICGGAAAAGDQVLCLPFSSAGARKSASFSQQSGFSAASLASFCSFVCECAQAGRKSPHPQTSCCRPTARNFPASSCPVILSPGRRQPPAACAHEQGTTYLAPPSTSMGGQEQLLCATLLALFFQGISISGNAASENEFITIKQKGNTVFLICEGGNNETNWTKGGMALSHQGKELSLGSVMDDPRGFFECGNNNKKNRSLQVFFRMCQNCIRLDYTTILAISVASLLATVFLAVAVYHMAVEERGQPSQASDKQSLLANDQLYQPLREHNYGPYSHIGAAKPRHR